MPLARPSHLSQNPLVWSIYDLSEGLIGEIVEIVGRAAIAAVLSGQDRITQSIVAGLGYVPVSRRRNAAMRSAMM